MESKDYKKLGYKEYRNLEQYENRCYSKIIGKFQNENQIINEFEKILCRATIILGDSEPLDNTDKAIRDLLSDAFDSLYISRKLISKGYATLAFTLLRRAYEDISLIHYFTILPEKAIDWQKMKKIGNSEIRCYLDKHPLGESGQILNNIYAFFSTVSHPNRHYIPERFLGERNKFVLGAAGKPNDLVVSNYINYLIRLWYWFSVLISEYYKQLFNEKDEKYVFDILKLIENSRKIGDELYGKIIKINAG